MIEDNAVLAAENSANESDSFLDKVKKTFSETKEGFSSVQNKVSDITGSVESSISSLLDLIVFYILQTVLLPIVFLFVFYKALRLMLAVDFKTK